MLGRTALFTGSNTITHLPPFLTVQMVRPASVSVSLRLASINDNFRVAKAFSICADTHTGVLNTLHARTLTEDLPQSAV